ncbi:MAG: UDP-N-acetylmuramoyl-tripeptide--D-alanyl-D-alanine ligase [Verrucomicrobiota bacterium]
MIGRWRENWFESRGTNPKADGPMESVLKEGEVVFRRPFFDEQLSAEWINDADFAGATGFAIDSRKISAGEIFVALKTANRDGHDYLVDALSRNASAALVEHPREEVDLPQIVVESTEAALQTLGSAWRKEWGGRVIAVTGSCGKTSTKEVLGLLLGEEDTFVTPGNLNNYLGVPLSELQLRTKHKRAVLEAGINEPGEMANLARMIDPQVAVVTTIGPAHLEKLGSLERIAEEKAHLPLRASERVFLGPACSEYGAFTEAGFSDPHWLLPVARTIIHPPEGELWRYNVVSDLETGQKTVRIRNQVVVEFPLPEVTAGMVENICLALTVVLREGVSLEKALKRLENWSPARQRGEVIEVGGRTVYADHYNANPASFADAVTFFHNRFEGQTKVWILGGMEELGEESPAWHRQLATALPVEEGDRVFLVGEATKEMISTVERSLGSEAVLQVNAVEEILDKVKRTEGIIFLKGSRKFRLEKVLESLAEDVS